MFEWKMLNGFVIGSRWRSEDVHRSVKFAERDAQCCSLRRRAMRSSAAPITPSLDVDDRRRSATIGVGAGDDGQELELSPRHRASDWSESRVERPRLNTGAAAVLFSG